jgi:hypothetical protein
MCKRKKEKRKGHELKCQHKMHAEYYHKQQKFGEVTKMPPKHHSK